MPGMARESPVIRLDPVWYGAFDFDGVNAAETLDGDICLSASRKAFSAYWGSLKMTGV
jgi:hypothetical protein